MNTSNKTTELLKLGIEFEKSGNYVSAFNCYNKILIEDKLSIQAYIK
jgi:hypothetical protein